MKLIIGSLALFIERVDAIGESSSQPKCRSLCSGEGSTFVETRIIQNGFASNSDSDLGCRGHDCFSQHELYKYAVMIATQLHTNK